MTSASPKEEEHQQVKKEEVIDSFAAETVIISDTNVSEQIKEEKQQQEEKKQEDLMEEDDSMPTTTTSTSSSTVFQIRLKQPQSNLLYKMSVPKLCRNFSATAWCAKLNAIACASETCARIPSSSAHPPFWIPIHIVNPERPTECAVFNVTADSPRDSVQFIEWSPSSCTRALLVANFHGRITIWTQPSKSSTCLAKDFSCWQCEHEWRQDIAVVTKWMSGISPYSWVSSNSGGPSYSKFTFEERFFSQRPQSSARWPNFLCVCSVFSSGSVQLHWAKWPLSHSAEAPKWFSTSKGLLGAGPSGIMAGDAIITEAGTMHVAGVPLVNPSTVVVWEVTPGPGNGFQGTALINTSNGVPPSLDPPRWTGYSRLAAYLFSWQEFMGSEIKEGKKQTDLGSSETVSLHCSPVSNFSAYVSPEAAAQSAAATTWGSGVTTVAFDPTQGGSVISVIIVEGQYMSPYDPDEGPSITGWRVQCWESSLQPVVLHPIFENAASSLGGQTPMQTVWVTRVNKTIPPMKECLQDVVSLSASCDKQSTFDPHAKKAKRLSFDFLDLPSDIRTLARIVYSAHGGEVAVSFLNGGVHIFSGASFTPVDSYVGNVTSAIAAPSFSSTGCCLASVWHDTNKDCTTVKITRVLPNIKLKMNSAIWERAIADRFWWSLVVGVDWWDAVGCTQSAAEDGIVSLNSLIAVLDADFHSLSSAHHRQQYRPSLDRIKCRLLEGTSAQEVRALVLDMQARLLLDMLGNGIESALINPATLVSEPWPTSGEMLSGIDPDAMTVEPALVSSIQAYVDAVLDLASHFITRLRRYASFCRTLASHAVGTTAGVGSGRNMVTSSAHSSESPPTNQGGQSGTTSSSGSSQMQAWVQGAIAKISSTTDGVSNSPPNPRNGPSTFIPISINTGTFPGTPAVRLIGDCHFLHRLCQLLLFCYIFWRRQMPRYSASAQKDLTRKEPNTVSTRPASAMKSEEAQATRNGQGVKGGEEGSGKVAPRLGSGNAGHGYTHEEVKVLFLITVELCRRTAGLAHPFPVSQVGGSNIQICLHYIDGNYTVLPEVVEASLGPFMQEYLKLDLIHKLKYKKDVYELTKGILCLVIISLDLQLLNDWEMDNMPRPRGADAAGLLLRELDLHPPAEEWHRRNMLGGPWSDTEDLGPLDDSLKLSTCDLLEFNLLNDYDSSCLPRGLWPRKRRFSERDAAFGLKSSVGLGPYLGLMGSRRDVLTAVWKKGLEGVWYKV
ncbi:hypothetical protein AQUCO_05400011v1 [Aquilegia coerulea]|uniref:Mediator of RNA polymerase II transcription subunit 16 n=1 Tax=Aquilegia coerulea TaxID=218851 RepID=A0A2G5CH55_AQUCA|nr:hypothetical protein AQUCO_05400011v1 [Aquilegia coerulea]